MTISQEKTPIKQSIEKMTEWIMNISGKIIGVSQKIIPVSHNTVPISQIIINHRN